MEANVSPATVLYYFESKEELFHGAISSILEEFYERRLRIIERSDDARVRLVTMIYEGIPDRVPEEMRVLLEVTSMAPSMPQLQPYLMSIVEKQVNLYFTIIEIGAGLGVFRPTPNSFTVARNLIALEDAYDLYPVFGMNQNRQDVRDGVLSYAELALSVDLKSVRPALGT